MAIHDCETFQVFFRRGCFFAFGRTAGGEDRWLPRTSNPPRIERMPEMVNHSGTPTRNGTPTILVYPETHCLVKRFSLDLHAFFQREHARVELSSPGNNRLRSTHPVTRLSACRARLGLRRCLPADPCRDGHLKEMNAATEHDQAHQHRRPGLDDVVVPQQHEVAHIEEPQAEYNQRPASNFTDPEHGALTFPNDDDSPPFP